jgi:hypothetical protein
MKSKFVVIRTPEPSWVQGRPMRQQKGCEESWTFLIDC